MKLSVKMHAVTKITNIARFCKMCQRRALNCELYEKLENTVFLFRKNGKWYYYDAPALLASRSHSVS